MVIKVITVSFIFGTLLFFLPYGFGWNIWVLGGFFHHGLLD
jgi:hypothetical protein